MNDKPLYVFDTNVIVSALLVEQAMPARAFRAALDHGEILLSRPVLKELNEGLTREKLKPYLLPEERERFVIALLNKSIFIDIEEKIQVCRDPKDDKFLELAANGGGAWFFNGGGGLFIFNPLRGLPNKKT